MKVRTSHDTIEDFSKSKIVNALVNEANAPVRVAEKIADEVESYLSRIGVSPTTTMIREMVNAKLLEYGFDDLAAYHQRLGLPIYDVNRILTSGHRMDSSTAFNPESIHKHMGDVIARHYALSAVIPPEIADAHRRGLIHIHDLEYFVTRPYCFAHDLRFFLRKGLRVDGSGRDTAVAGPAKHAEVAIFHAAKALAASQVFWSGGHSFNHFNVIMAPYVEGKNGTEIRQLCQMFVYEMSQQYVARGGQMVLSSVGLIPGIPGVLEDVEAVKPGGMVGPETYSEYHDEAVRIFRQLLEVLLSGDYTGKPFPFPAIEIKLDPEFMKDSEEEYLLACGLASRFGTPLFLNGMADGISSLNCCVEPGLIVEGTGDHYPDFRGGILQEATVNLPRVALDSQGNVGRFFEMLVSRMELVRDLISLKRKVLAMRMDEGSLRFADQSFGGSKYLRLDEQRMMIGILGLNEAVKIMTESELHQNGDARDFANKVLERMRETTGEFSAESESDFHICQSPSYDSNNRLAQIDGKRFRSRYVAQGESSEGSAYYTQGAQIRASAEIGLEERLSFEQPLCSLLSGGAIFNVNLGGRPPREVLWRETTRIAESGVPLFTYTQDLSLCLKCGGIVDGLHSRCPSCQSNRVDWISRKGGRIGRVGAQEDIGGWNAGLVEELLSRHRYRL